MVVEALKGNGGFSITQLVVVRGRIQRSALTDNFKRRNNIMVKKI
jgi:hypothetical protein